MKWETHYFVIDFETGSLSSDKGLAMEIAIVVLNEKLEEAERRQLLIKPYKEATYDAKALALHGISIAETQEKGTSTKEIVSLMLAMAKKYTLDSFRKPVLVGHNFINFDLKFLKDIFELEKAEVFKPFSTFMLDTQELMRVKHGYHEELPDFKLQTCCQYYNISLRGAHRAMADTQATAELFRRLISDFRFGGQTIEKEIRYRETFRF
jgi:DNA polymerase III epsilon subunit-like protein